MLHLARQYQQMITTGTCFTDARGTKRKHDEEEEEEDEDDE